MTLLLKYSGILNNIVTKVPSDEVQDFIDKLKTIYPSYKENKEMKKILYNLKIKVPIQASKKQ